MIRPNWKEILPLLSLLCPEQPNWLSVASEARDKDKKESIVSVHDICIAWCT